MAFIVWNRNPLIRRRLWLKDEAGDLDRFWALQVTIVIVMDCDT
jgi:hypothetical protein